MTGSLLASCTPATRTPPAVYQASLTEIRQAMEELIPELNRLPAYQSLYLWPKQSNASRITLTSLVRIRAEAEGLAVVNVNDDREVVFNLEEKSGLTYLTYSKVGNVDTQVMTVLNALDRRFVRVNLP